MIRSMVQPCLKSSGTPCSDYWLVIADETDCEREAYHRQVYQGQGATCRVESDLPVDLDHAVPDCGCEAVQGHYYKNLELKHFDIVLVQVRPRSSNGKDDDDPIQ